MFETILTKEDSTTHLSIKFTKSLFMEKQVLVVNITDHTDRDLLIAANASNEYKTRLLSSVSHELRTPLNGSINFTEQALSEPLVPKEIKEKWLLPALRSNQLLLSLVNDILDFSQMHVGKLRLVFEPKSVVETAKSCLELVELQARKKKLKLELQNNLVENEEIINTDHNRLKQIMLNLLSNAVKFTFEGSVSLILDPISSELISPQTPLRPSYNHQRFSRASTNGFIPKGIRVTCKDTGIGINSENQKKLFQAFEKFELGNKPLTINSTGAGLGLVIANNLVQRLNPQDTLEGCEVIKFISEENFGTTFCFEVLDRGERSSEHINNPNDLSVCSDTGLGLLCLEELGREVPLRKNDVYKELLDTCTFSPTNMSPARKYYKPKNPTNCKCPKILIVDDDTFNLTALDQILSKLKYMCDWALNGKEAVEKIKARQVNRCGDACKQYKMMFLDCQMPILNGFETAALLKQMMNEREIDRLRIVGCTAFIQEADEKRAREAGMDDFCTKPINIAAIKEKIKDNLIR